MTGTSIASGRTDSATTDVAVIGAGVIGLGIAWRCAQRGLAVTVLDPDPGRGATWTAAGMLAPITEVHFGEAALAALNRDSARRYPDFVEELRQATGLDVGYRRSGTIVAAWDGADLAGLRDLAAYIERIGLGVEMLTSRELRRLEPRLATGLPGGLHAVDDHQIDNRRLHSALAVAVERAGARVQRDSVRSIVTTAGAVSGLQLASGQQITVGTVVLAAGAWSGLIAGIDGSLPPVRPVKGQTVRLRLTGPPLSSIVRGTVKGNPVYVVGRADGEVVVGASTEDAGFDLRARAGAVYELLRDAQSLLPVLGEAEFVAVSTSVRPGSPDNAPLLGAASIPGLVIATGHYRNGILLTPVTADAMADLIVDGRIDPIIAGFSPSRFDAERVNANATTGRSRVGVR